MAGPAHSAVREFSGFPESPMKADSYYIKISNFGFALWSGQPF